MLVQLTQIQQRCSRPLTATSLLFALCISLVGCSDSGGDVQIDEGSNATSPATPTANQPPETDAESIANSDGPLGIQPVSTETAKTDGWFQFRGPNGDGSIASQNLPITWSQDQGIAWKQPLHGPGSSTPIIWGDRIYLTCYTGYGVPRESGGSLENLQRHLLALQLRDGETIWNKSVPAALPEEERIRDHGYAANTPVADSERVYAFFGKSGVIAFDHDGKQLWSADVGRKTSGWGTASSLLLYKDLVIVNASVEDGALLALDRTTGDEKWRARGIRESWNTPIIAKSPAGRDELIVAIHGKILGFNPQSGEQLWSCDTDITWYMVPSPVVADGVVYYLGGRSGITSLAVRIGGSGDVTQSHRLWKTNKGSNVSSPVYRDGHLYWMNDQQGIAYCADARTGDLKYEERLQRAGQVYSSALIAGDRIYYLTRSGRTIVVAAKPQFEQLAVNELRDGSLFNGSPSVAGDRLLIRSDKFLYCIGK